MEVTMRQGIRFVLVTFVFLLALVAAGDGIAGTLPHVSGAGGTGSVPLVQLNARATGDAALGDPLPATGTFHAKGTPWGDLSGGVTCMGFISPSTFVVSGTLDNAVSSGGFTSPNFVLLMAADGSNVTWIHVLVAN